MIRGDLRSASCPLGHRRVELRPLGRPCSRSPPRAPPPPVEPLAEQQHLVRLLARDISIDQRHDHEREQPDVDLGRAEPCAPPWRRSGRGEGDPEGVREHVAVGGGGSWACRARRATVKTWGRSPWRSTCGSWGHRRRNRPGSPPTRKTFSCEEARTTTRTPFVRAAPPRQRRRSPPGEQLGGQELRVSGGSSRVIVATPLGRHS